LDAIQARCDVIVGSEEAVAGGLTAVMLIILALSAGTSQTETYTLNQQAPTPNIIIDNQGEGTMTDNLAVIPTNFQAEIDYWDYIVYDTTVKHGTSNSIRLDADYVRGTRECNRPWLNLSPGMRVVFGVWCKTNPETNTLYTGGRIGIDLYAACEEGVYICDGLPRDLTNIGGTICSGDLPSDHFDAGGENPNTILGNPAATTFKVPWGTDWTYIQYDLIVPNTDYFKRNNGEWLFDDHHSTKIIGCLAWFDARELTESTAWFADSVFYVLSSGPYATPTLAAPTVTT
jgi:hypothetical protein